MSEADVRALHSEATADGMDPWCKADAQAWPCSTITALDRPEPKSSYILDARWQRYITMFADAAMPRDAFDLIAAARSDLGSRELHRIWLTPEPQPRDPR